MPQTGTVPLVRRLERIRDLSNDLAREVTRSSGQTAVTRAMADAIKQEVDAVLRALNSRDVVP